MIRTITTALVVALCCAATANAQSENQAPRPAAAAAAVPAPVNINTATQPQLEALPGIGAAMAGRILEYRQKNGGFKKVEDLMNVRGIGERNFLRLKPLVTVGAPRPAQ